MSRKMEFPARKQGQQLKSALMLYQTIKQAKDGHKILIPCIGKDIILTVNIVERQGIRGMEFGSVIVEEINNAPN